MVVCFSGTGNSRYCARLLAQELSDEVVDCGHYIRNQIAADLVSGKPWVFVCPTYAWQLPRIFEQFIRSGSFMGSTDAYFVMTCGSDIGNAEAYIRTLCDEKQLHFCGVAPVVMPENYIAMFSVPDAEEAKRIIAAAEPGLYRTADQIRQGKMLPAIQAGVKDKTKSGPVNAVFYKKYVKADDFYVTDRCVSCGKCEEACVLGNISLERGKPVWGERCTHCMACICGCPAEAIEYGKKSRGKPRYQCPVYKGKGDEP